MLFYMVIADEFDNGHCVIKVKVTVGILKLFHLQQYKLSDPITKLWHMVRRMKIKTYFSTKNILDEFNVGHCGIKIKVTIALEKFNHLIFQISSRWLFIADSCRRHSKRHKILYPLYS